MKQLTKTSFQKLKSDLLSSLKQTQDSFIEKTGKTVYVAPMDAHEMHKKLVENGYVCLQNGPKLTESGIVLVNLCGVKL